MSDIPLLEVRDLVLEMGQGSENVRLLDGLSCYAALLPLGAAVLGYHFISVY